MPADRDDTLTLLFWANCAAFAAHVLDESLMGGGFVPFIQRHFWSGFALGDFFTANAVWLALIAAGNILYDWRGRALAFVPLAFVWERCFNACFHIGSSLYFGEYSPGLLTGVLFFVLLYLVIRFGVLRGHVRWGALAGSGAAALTFETVFVSSMWWAH